MSATIRHCTGENTQTMQIEASSAWEAWAMLGDWAAQNPVDHVWQARLTYSEAEDVFYLIAYWTEG